MALDPPAGKARERIPIRPIPVGPRPPPQFGSRLWKPSRSSPPRVRGHLCAESGRV